MQSELSSNKNVDDEWMNYMLKCSGTGRKTSDEVKLDSNSERLDSIADAFPIMMDEIEQVNSKFELKDAPKCGELHISTKTKVLYLNCKIDTLKTFWRVPVIDYWRPIEGVVKKQTKITSFSQEELDESQERLRNCQHHYTEMVIKSASKNVFGVSGSSSVEVVEDNASSSVEVVEDNASSSIDAVEDNASSSIDAVEEPTANTTASGQVFTYNYRYGQGPVQTLAKRLKFKDDRKITIGISKKDIMNCRGKQKKAFMNCFAIIIRLKYKGEFREVHVKVFNTGKLEIPGVPDDNMLKLVREKVIEYLQPHLDIEHIRPENGIGQFHENPNNHEPNNTANRLQYIKGCSDDGDEDVLINSGFHCGFCIDQKSFYSILRSEKYGIETSYDSCHYPGIRCKYYYRNDLPKDHPNQGRICLEDNGIKLSQLELSKKYTCVSFMIFSTGNCLVVGNCSNSVLLHVFEFIKRTLEVEYGAICSPNESVATKLKKKKQRKKTVHMQMHYYSASMSGNL